MKKSKHNPLMYNVKQTAIPQSQGQFQQKPKLKMGESKKLVSSGMKSMFDSTAPIPPVKKMSFTKQNTLNSLARSKTVNSMKDNNYIPDYKEFTNNLPNHLFFKEEMMSSLADNPIQLIKLKKAREKVIENYNTEIAKKNKELNDPVNLVQATRLKEKQENLIREINAKQVNLNSTRFELNHILENKHQASILLSH
jgi:hypothetical protein